MQTIIPFNFFTSEDAFKIERLVSKEVGPDVLVSAILVQDIYDVFFGPMMTFRVDGSLWMMDNLIYCIVQECENTKSAVKDIKIGLYGYNLNFLPQLTGPMGLIQFAVKIYCHDGTTITLEQP